MSDRKTARVRKGVLAVVAACVGLLAPAGASAANFVNGDFETGTLAGWQVVDQAGSNGTWLAYTGTKPPISGEAEPRVVAAPPQGNFAAISDQTAPGGHTLYQDVALESGLTDFSMLVYYDSVGALTTPSPDTLAYTTPPNQQFRIDVMKPSAPLDSLSPDDVLVNLFKTSEGDPQALAPKLVTADLSRFAGQTVRLRVVEVDTLGFFNASVDAVGLTGPPPPPPVPSNSFSFGKLKLNKKKGTGQLEVNVPGPGTLAAVDSRSAGVKKAGSSAQASKRKASPKLIKKVTVSVEAAGKAILKLKPTAAGKKILKQKGKLKFKALVTFTPTGGTAATQTFSGKLKLKPKPKSGD